MHKDSWRMRGRDKRFYPKIKKDEKESVIKRRKNVCVIGVL